VNSLKEFLASERAKSKSKLVNVVKQAKKAIKNHEFSDLLFLMTEFLEMDVKENAKPPIMAFFEQSNLFYMGDDIEGTPMTMGADPEFILCEIDDEDEIILYSSKYPAPIYQPRLYSMSSLSIGADYGLLEIRPDYVTSSDDLADEMLKLTTAFEDFYKRDELRIKIKRAEAVPFMHKMERMREMMEDPDGVEIDYGGGRMKAAGVQQVTSNIDIATAGAELYGVSLTAYDTPGFTKETDKILTAGGHIHFGGACVKVLSMTQLKSLVRKLDEVLVPMAKTVETSAGELRREYYGILGEFRLKEYGFEYRVLSCAPFWPENSKLLKKLLKKAEKIVSNFDFIN